MNILAAGSPLVDLLAHVADKFLQVHVPGAKGGMEMVDPAWQRQLVQLLDGQIARAPGGSAGNTAFALARLGIPCAMLGKLGRDDDGEFYRTAFEQCGGRTDEFLTTDQAPTGNCLSLITPDAERTMRSALGAALLLEVDEIRKLDFSHYDLLYIEGYLLFSPVFEVLLECAHQAGCRIGLDLASFEVVRAFKSKLPHLLEQYVDVLFANADEAYELCGTDNVAAQLEYLGNLCDIAVVKQGAHGSWARRGAETIQVAACTVEHPVDTTAAGDLYAAGFLYGLATGAPLERCAWYGSVISAEVVKVIGSALPESVWTQLRNKLIA